jgi:hypothetical protein
MNAVSAERGGGGGSDKTTEKKFWTLFPYIPFYDIEINLRLSTSIYIILLPQVKKVGAARCEFVFDVHTSKASKRLKVVLPPPLHLWRINVKTPRGFINISLTEFYMDKTAPKQYYELYNHRR